ncbi:MAG TPA: hypothetical protein VM183_20830 [Burkholderiales bacterium]|nr:hypothetical protein [Burkholderiales bacterium]
MSDPILAEIRDLLKEQNRLMAELKAQNDLGLLRQTEQVAKAEALGQKTVGSARWLSAGVWLFIAALLVFFGASVIGQLAR